MKTITKLIYTALTIVILAIATVTANAAVGDLYVSSQGSGGNGGGLVYEYTPTGQQSTFASGLPRPRGVGELDSRGNLVVATNFFDGTEFEASVLKITPTGVQITIATLGNYFLEGVAIDQLGNVFVFGIDGNNPPGPSPIFKISPDGAQSTFGSVPGPGFGLAFDAAGNLFAADGGQNIQTIYKFTADGTRSVFVGPTAFGAEQAPFGLAFDQFGNLFVSTNPFTVPGGNDVILEFTPDGMESTFATGLNYPKGTGFDRSGNLFVAELIPTGVGDILKFTPDGNRTVFASNIMLPEFLAFQPPLPPRPRPTPHPRPLLP